MNIIYIMNFNILIFVLQTNGQISEPDSLQKIKTARSVCTTTEIINITRQENISPGGETQSRKGSYEDSEAVDDPQEVEYPKPSQDKMLN